MRQSCCRGVWSVAGTWGDKEQEEEQSWVGQDASSDGCANTLFLVRLCCSAPVSREPSWAAWLCTLQLLQLPAVNCFGLLQGNQKFRTM